MRSPSARWTPRPPEAQALLEAREFVPSSLPRILKQIYQI